MPFGQLHSFVPEDSCLTYWPALRLYVPYLPHAHQCSTEGSVSPSQAVQAYLTVYAVYHLEQGHTQPDQALTFEMLMLTSTCSVITHTHSKLIDTYLRWHKTVLP